MGVRTDGVVAELIQAAVLSGAYRLQARKTPEAERGLMKMARLHHGRVNALCELICARMAIGPAGAQPW